MHLRLALGARQGWRLFYAMKQVLYRFDERRLHFCCVCEIYMPSWLYIRNGWTDLQWQDLFCVNKQDIYMPVRVLPWPTHRTDTKGNQYSTSAIGSTPYWSKLEFLSMPMDWCYICILQTSWPSKRNHLERINHSWRRHANTSIGEMYAAFSLSRVAACTLVPFEPNEVS